MEKDKHICALVFHAWLNTPLLLLLTICIAGGAAGKKVTILLPNSSV